MSDDAIVESRRFRTWDESRALEADHRVRLLIKAQFLRFQKNWVFWVVFGIGVIGAIGALMAPFGQAEDGWYVDGLEVAFGFFGGAAPLVGVAAILFGSATIAEDLRFNAPLFYFSRPVRVWDYVLAKVGFTFATLGLLVGMGLVTTLLSTLLTITSEPPQQAPWMSDLHYAQILEQWSVSGVTHVGDWLFLALVLVLGTFSVVLFLSTTVVAVSSFTKRAWHAAVGFIVLVGATGFIGLGLGIVVASNAYEMMWGPFGWFFGATILPLWAYFEPSEPMTRGAPVVAIFSHLFLIAWSLLAVRITYARVQRMEGAL